jgi:hypothetical protein
MEFPDNNALAMKYILKRDSDRLEKLDKVHQRSLIYLLRNDLDDLEFYFDFLKNRNNILSPGTYHYDNIDDMATFDLYNKFDYFGSFFKGDVDTKYWDYCLNKGYVIEDDSYSEDSDTE